MASIRTWLALMAMAVLVAGFSGCMMDDDDDDDMVGPQVLDPNTAPKASVDRFSAQAGHLFVRMNGNGLPGANQAINMDDPALPFKTKGLGPSGGMVQYYNFDVMPTEPADIFVLRREGASDPVPGQLNIVDVKPGDAGYSDFWRVHMVTVPADYVANTVHSVQQINAAGYPIQETTTVVNCPIVPEGSTAGLRLGGGNQQLTRGWYRDQVVFYFNFDEDMLMVASGEVPVSDIFVSFNVNPDQPNGGPGSGFRTEEDMMQTHNVVATLPMQPGYPPLWSVDVYDNAAFDMVSDLSTAAAAPILGMDVALVNCPIVAVP